MNLPEKNTIRTHMLAQRAVMGAIEALGARNVIISRISEVVSGNATIVAGYRTIRGEVDINTIFQHVDFNYKKSCLPVVEAADKPLIFREWRSGEKLEKGPFGVEVPGIHAAVVIPDYVLVPLVAFDRAGHRLGYGAGYYDRTIRHLRVSQKNLQIIGVGYSMQEVETIPTDTYDERLDMIVTEKEIITIPALVAGSGHS